MITHNNTKEKRYVVKAKLMEINTDEIIKDQSIRFASYKSFFLKKFIKKYSISPKSEIAIIRLTRDRYVENLPNKSGEMCCAIKTTERPNTILLNKCENKYNNFINVNSFCLSEVIIGFSE